MLGGGHGVRLGLHHRDDLDAEAGQAPLGLVPGEAEQARHHGTRLMGIDLDCDGGAGLGGTPRLGRLVPDAVRRGAVERFPQGHDAEAGVLQRRHGVLDAGAERRRDLEGPGGHDAVGVVDRTDHGGGLFHGDLQRQHVLAGTQRPSQVAGARVDLDPDRGARFDRRQGAERGIGERRRHEGRPDLGGPGATGHGELGRGWLHRYLALGVPHPHRGGQLRGEPDEPGVVVVLGGAGLAGHRSTDLGPDAGPGSHDLGERRRHLPGHRRVEGLGHHRDPAPHLDTVAGLDRRHQAGGEVEAVEGEGPVGGRHLQHGDLLGAEHHRVERIQLGRDPGGMGHLDHLLGSDRVDELGVDLVDREAGGIEQGQVGEGLVLVVGHRPGAGVGVDGDAGTSGEDRVEGERPLEGGGQRERLERRAGLSAALGGEVEPGDRVVLVVEVLATDERLDLAGRRFDHGHRAAGPVLGQHRGDGRLGCLLDRRIESGADREAPSEHGVVPVRGGGPERLVVEEGLLDDLGEVRVPVDERRRLLDELEGLGVGLRRLVGGERADSGHLLEDHPATAEGGVLVGEGVPRRRVLDEPRQQGGLADREVGDLLPEVVGRGRPDPVRTVAEVDGVDVPSEDLLLGESLLEPHRQLGLLELPLERDLGGEDDVLDVLLGDRRPALGDALGLGIGDERSGDGPQVDAGVVPETLVLDRDDGIDEVAWQVVVLDHDPVLLGVPLGDDRPVGGEHDAGQAELAEPGIGQRIDLGSAATACHGEGGEHGDETTEARHPRIIGTSTPIS